MERRFQLALRLRSTLRTFFGLGSPVAGLLRETDGVMVGSGRRERPSRWLRGAGSGCRFAPTCRNLLALGLGVIDPWVAFGAWVVRSSTAAAIQSTRAINTCCGPWTPSVISSSMSAERLGPVISTTFDGRPSGNQSSIFLNTSPGVDTMRRVDSNTRCTFGRSDASRPLARLASTTT